jgi:hypothetical protein
MNVQHTVSATAPAGDCIAPSSHSAASSVPDALPAPLQPAPSSVQPTTVLPFTPAPGESTRAFEAFCAYFELGPRRRYSAAARKVGVSVRTIERWSSQFDWRERITASAAQGAEQFMNIQEAERGETAARTQSLRERQIVLAESIVNLTERYFERLDDMDLEHIRLPDVCRALVVASRLVNQSPASDPAAQADHSLRDQLASLLDQAFRETPKPVSP